MGVPRHVAVTAATLAALIAGALPAAAYGDSSVSYADATVRALESQRVTAGGSHTCTIDNGALRCFGSNAVGQSGLWPEDGELSSSLPPSAIDHVSLGGTPVAITAGYKHACALLADGDVRCWGENAHGELGLGNTDTIGDNESPSAADPVDLGDREAIAISAGYGHTCALTADGNVFCWGRGASGALGYGNNRNIGDNEDPADAGPVPILPSDSSTTRRVVALDAGGEHTCAIFDDGQVKCWGLGADGRRGQGTETIGDDEPARDAETVALGGRARAISAGAKHTCALLDGGRVRCWGDGANGRLGTGSLNDVGDNEVPEDVAPVELGREAVGVSAGDAHTCALLDNGAVRCWGLGSNGRLGYANTTTIGDSSSRLPASAGPVELGPGRSAVAISAGFEHTCARLDNGELTCWGNGADGRLGRGNTTTIGDNEHPADVLPADLGAATEITGVSAGTAHTCALVSNGTVRCWGSAAFGLLGNPVSEDIGDDEVPAEAWPVELDREAIAVSAGDRHTCVVLDNGAVRCWGLGTGGRLGLGDSSAETIGDDETPVATEPVALGASREAVAIEAGNDHTCALLDDSTARCWGLNGNGQLGYGHDEAIGDDEEPAAAGPVRLGRSALALEVGGGHSCALLDNGTVRCWGRGSEGQLGYANTASIGVTQTPDAVGPVSLGRPVKALDVGGTHSCALLSHGRIRCWGRGSNGRLGYGSAANIGDNEHPSSMPGIDVPEDARAIGLGEAHSCAVMHEGQVRCWGRGSNGQLGLGDDEDIGDTEHPGQRPTVDVGNTTALQIDGGRDHTCAVLENGALRCWGDGANGRTGLGATTDIGDDELPRVVPPVPVFAGAGTPTAVDDSLRVSMHSGRRELDVLANDVDVGPGPKRVVAVTQPGNGTVSIVREGAAIEYRPNSGYCNDFDEPDGDGPPDRFTYMVNGGSSASVDVRVYCGHFPIAVDDTITIDLDLPRQPIAVRANDVDLDGGTIKVASVTQPKHGTASIYGGGAGVFYEIDPGYCNDPGGEPDTFTYTLDPGGSTATVFVTVPCPDTPPVAHDDSITLTEDDAATIVRVLDNDSNPDNFGPMNVASVTQPPNGAAEVADGGQAVRYVPDPNYCNHPGSGSTDDFTYKLNGGSTAKVSVRVTCVDDAPVAVDDRLAVTEDDPASPIDVLANDTDIDGGPKRIASATQPENGTVAVMADGSGLTYKPDPDYCNEPLPRPEDRITYTLDPGGSTATLRMVVHCTEDPLVAVDDTATVAEDDPPTEIRVLANDRNPDFDRIEIESTTDPAHGEVLILPGKQTLTYEPDADYCNDGLSTDDFTYRLNGGSTATVAVTVTCVDSAPFAPPAEEGPSGESPEGGRGGLPKIKGRRLKVARSGRVRVLVQCPRSAEFCEGKLRLEARKPSRGKRALAGARYRLDAGEKVKVTFKLKRRTVKLVRARRKARRALVIATANDTGEQARKRVKLVPA